MSKSRCSLHGGILSVHCRISSTLERYHDSSGGTISIIYCILNLT